MIFNFLLLFWPSVTSRREKIILWPFTPVLRRIWRLVTRKIKTRRHSDAATGIAGRLSQSPLPSCRFFRRERSDDFFEARIIAQRIPATAEASDRRAGQLGFREEFPMAGWPARARQSKHRSQHV